MTRRITIIGRCRQTRLSAWLPACVLTLCATAVLDAQSPVPISQAAVNSSEAAHMVRSANERQASERLGSLVIAGGGTLPDAIVERFLELGGNLNTRLVVVTTASSLADTPDMEWRLAFWHEQPVRSVHVLHTKDRKVADSPEFSSILDDATAVWFTGGNQLNITGVYAGTRTEERLLALLHRGGVIGGTSAGAAIMSRVMIGGNTPQGPLITTGFDLLPGTIIDQHFLKRNRQSRLFKALSTQPGLVGIGIDEGTALVVTPKQLEVVGESEVVVCLAGTEHRREVSQRFRPGDVFDLGKWTLAATGRARWDTYGKADKRPVPEVPQGAVVIAGRKTPQAAVEEFLAAAGGKTAPVVLVTEAQKDVDESTLQSQLEECFSVAGAENVRMCRATTAAELEQPDVKQALAQARGVWFVGAQERRMLDFVLQARMDRLVREVLERGGAVGGSSAGAKIHGDGVLTAADSEDDTDPLGDVYACGLGVLPGVVIEHQLVDNASASSMARSLKQRFPWCMGLGLQDSAAVVVRGHTMQVLGSDSVAVIGEPGDSEDSAAAVEMVQAGQKYDLRERRVMESAAEESTR